MLCMASALRRRRAYDEDHPPDPRVSRIIGHAIPETPTIKRTRDPRGKATKPSACPSASSSKIRIDRCLPGNVLLSRLLLLSFIELGFDTEAYTLVSTHKSISTC